MHNPTKTKKKLQFVTETVVKLQDNLTLEQLKAVGGGQEPRTDGCGSIRTVC
jgi:hypothetical protein